MRVLLLEDDDKIGSAVRDHLAAAGHGVDWARDIAAATEFLAVTAFDLVLLDMGLPDGDGLTVLKRIRQRAILASVIILSARSRVADRIAGLNAGADDFLVKPFDLSELDARVNAVARRVNGKTGTEETFGALTIDHALKRITRHGQPVELTAREWTVLERLTRRAHETVSKGAIENALYEYDADVDSNTVEVYVSRLRKKLGRDAIKTLRGLGYQMSREGR
ncbi:response regulator [Brevirhabdus sp.]|uniref:response regulator n=1 Tax=Brevirhabdus sp. TaxID=2004514 RepID=UPI00405882A9